MHTLTEGVNALQCGTHETTNYSATSITKRLHGIQNINAGTCTHMHALVLTQCICCFRHVIVNDAYEATPCSERVRMSKLR